METRGFPLPLRSPLKRTKPMPPQFNSNPTVQTEGGIRVSPPTSPLAVVVSTASSSMGMAQESSSSPTVPAAAASSSAQLHFSIPLRAISAAGSSTSSLYPKRIARDDPLSASMTGASSGSATMADMDMSMMSPLCHQLMETKKRMLSVVSSPITDASSRSDDELLRDHPSAGYKQSKLKTNGASANAVTTSGDAMSPDAILQRKAQRRREQVRAASRRCRDRQRKETEELRKKVFQLEEFISHTIKSYEWELRQQQQQVDALTKEYSALLQQVHSGGNMMDNNNEGVDNNGRLAVTSTHSPAAVEQPVFDVLIKSEEVVPFSHSSSMGQQPQPQQHQGVYTKDATASPEPPKHQLLWQEYDDVDRIYRRVEETKQILSKILIPPVHPDISQKAFGWKFHFWLEGTRYYAKTRKFFAGVRSLDIAQRMHRIEPAKYIETFPEVHEKKILKVFTDNMKIVKTVKALPGKPQLGSVTVQFVSHDDEYPGNRWFFANRSVGLPKSTNYGHHEECNGYAFEDITKTMDDGSVIEGCLVQGCGGYDSMGKEPEVLMSELAKAFSSVVLRWESLFVYDYMAEDGGFADIELDFDA
ncbi:hypothetical protein FI667_g3104, partial [Globisporangium splendens]